MSEAPDFPRIFYHPTEPSRIFESAEELRAAGSGWVKTPTEAADAAAKASTAQSGPQESTSTDEGSSAPRSRR